MTTDSTDSDSTNNNNNNQSSSGVRSLPFSSLNRKPSAVSATHNAATITADDTSTVYDVTSTNTTATVIVQGGGNCKDLLDPVVQDGGNTKKHVDAVAKKDASTSENIEKTEEEKKSLVEEEEEESIVNSQAEEVDVTEEKNPIDGATFDDVMMTKEALNPLVRPAKGCPVTSAICTRLHSIRGVSIQDINVASLRSFVSHSGIKRGRKAKKFELCNMIIFALTGEDPRGCTFFRDSSSTTLTGTKRPLSLPNTQPTKPAKTGEASSEVDVKSDPPKAAPRKAPPAPLSFPSHRFPPPIPPDLQIQEANKKSFRSKISMELGVEHLSPAGYQEAPVTGVLHGMSKRLMVNIVTRRRSHIIYGPRYSSFNVIFLCDPTSLHTFICKDVMNALLGKPADNDDIPETLLIKLADFPFAVEAQLTQNPTDCWDENVVGMDVLSQLKTTIYGKNLSFELAIMASDL